MHIFYLTVGMVIGSGLYVLGISTTLLIIVAQILFHLKHSYNQSRGIELINIALENKGSALSDLQAQFKEMDISTLNMKADLVEDNILDLEILVKMPKGFQTMELLEMIKKNHFIRSIEI